MADDNGNGRVTIAVLDQKIDALTAMVQEVRNGQAAQLSAIGELRTEDARLHGRIDRLNDRVSSLAGLQAAISAVLAAISGSFGSRS